ncbi:aldehyde dehydrogenase family protein [Ruegeria atlantica]|uniref:aldehyde dehydrogenase family protein n=1 Tax=Ruegeria atlantica TaxID=81569 RepID=UPI00147F60DF|nr:aldehyde dehydrogenase family protein [Ruegeria atlantica]
MLEFDTAHLPKMGSRIGDNIHTDSDNFFEVKSPIAVGALGQLPICSKEEVDKAVRVANRVFDKGTWSRMHPRDRRARLLNLAALMEKNAERMAQIETIDSGRPLREARNVDVAQSIVRLRWYAELIDKIYGEIAPSSVDRLGLISREPIGVVGAITPWNFPLMMAITKVAPALAAGNSVILKPPELSPLNALVLADLALEAGIPEGVFQVLTGNGRVTGEAMVRHPDIHAIAFTGSTEVGAHIMGVAAANGMKKVSLEAGGKSPHIVLSPECASDQMVEQIVWGIAYHQGQVCDAGASLVLVGDGHDELLQKIQAKFQSLTIGNPYNPEINLSSMIDANHMNGVHAAVEAAAQRGVNVACGGNPKDIGEVGAFYQPTLLTDVPKDDAIFTEEVFGPILVSTNVKSVDEAINLVNAQRYGLAGAVWSNDMAQAFQVANRLRIGTVAINTYELGDIGTPFGGTRESGLGRDRSAYALDNYTELKTTWAALDATW